MSIAQRFTVGLLKYFLDKRKVGYLINFSVVISLLTCFRNLGILLIGFVAVISLNYVKECMEKIDTANMQVQQLQYLFHDTPLERHIEIKLSGELIFDTVSAIVLSTVSVIGLTVILIKVLVDLNF